MRVFLFTLMSLACAVAASATVYKWVDENGVTHFSDQPHENAEKVQVAAPQTYKAPPVRGPAQAGQSGQFNQAQSANTYQSCQVTAPQDQETFPNTYSVTASVEVSPPPHDGAQLVVSLDDKPLPNFPAGGGSLTIDPIDRGSHTLRAVIQDPSGKTLCQSNVTFTVLQPSIRNPANPNFKH